MIAKINSGIAANPSIRWRFATFTLRRTKGYCDCNFINAWFKFRKHVLTPKPYLWFRVFERTKAGTLHAHVLLDSRFNIPFMPRAFNGQSLKNYNARLRPAARNFQQRLMNYGFGPIMNVESVMSNKAIPAYLAKYMSKGTSFHFRQKDDNESKRIRMYAASKGFYAGQLNHHTAHAISTYSAGANQSIPEGNNPYATGSVQAIQTHRRRAHTYYDFALLSAASADSAAIIGYCDTVEGIRKILPETKAICADCGHTSPFVNNVTPELRTMRSAASARKRYYYGLLLDANFVGGMNIIDWLIHKHGKERYINADSTLRRSTPSL